MTLSWPCRMLPAKNFAFDLAPRSLRGPSALNGFTQVTSSDAGIWVATLGGITIRKREQVLTFRALAALLDGMLTPILVPLCRGYQPIPAGAVQGGHYDPVPHGDDAPFDDGAGYVGTVTDAALAASAPLRAVTIRVGVLTGGTIEPGQHFSIGERAYRIRSVEDHGDGDLTIGFRPPLREAAIAGAPVEFDDPWCRMRLASDQELDLDLQLRRFGSPSVRFVEDL